MILRLFPCLRALTVLACALTVSSVCRADLLSCQNLYVGRIWIEQGFGLRAVVFLDDPSDSGGSYWQYFDNFSTDERKSALAVLTAAKLAQHRVNVATSASDQCSILTNAYLVSSVYLATSP
jgi:hypothetical protein